jgi:hypothetical protein
VFGVQGDAVELYRPWTSEAFSDNGGSRWTAGELADRVQELFDVTGIEQEPRNGMTRLRFSMTSRA